jgi:hypothetical protein
MKKTVGFLRAVKFAWLDKTVELVLENKTNEEIKKELNEYLAFEIKSPTTIRKTRDILMNMWVNPSCPFADIRQEALKVYPNARANHTALQYCVLLLTFSVISDLCGLIGKLSTIQDTFTTTWIKEKLYDVWGERETIDDSLKYILQSLKEFGVIESPKVGIYNIKKYSITDGSTIRVILMTILRLRGKAYYEVSELSTVPFMFPFNFNASLEIIHNSPDFILSNYGGKLTVAAND